MFPTSRHKSDYRFGFSVPYLALDHVNPQNSVKFQLIPIGGNNPLIPLKLAHQNFPARTTQLVAFVGSL